MPCRGKLNFPHLVMVVRLIEELRVEEKPNTLGVQQRNLIPTLRGIGNAPMIIMFTQTILKHYTRDEFLIISALYNIKGVSSPAEDGERACNSHMPCTDCDMLVITKNRK